MAMKASNAEITDLDIAQLFLNYFDKFGLPDHVHVFCEKSQITEDKFYEYFENLQEVRLAVWRLFFRSTFQVLMDDPTYSEFSVQEKLLSFYFTQVEVLNQYRTYILAENQSWYDPFPASMRDYRKAFKEYVKNLILEAIKTGEIADRRFFTDVYVEGFWIQLLFVIRFWLQDESPSQESTDGAIEKAVHLSFELISCGPLEAFIDFAKFVIQHKS